MKDKALGACGCIANVESAHAWLLGRYTGLRLRTAFYGSGCDILHSMYRAIAPSHQLRLRQKCFQYDDADTFCITAITQHRI